LLDAVFPLGGNTKEDIFVALLLWDEERLGIGL
jgi:hypothetical protein